MALFKMIESHGIQLQEVRKAKIRIINDLNAECVASNNLTPNHLPDQMIRVLPHDPLLKQVINSPPDLAKARTCYLY